MAQPADGAALQTTATSTSTRASWAAPTLWDKTKSGSATVYNKALLPGFNKAYKVVDKLGAPVNALSNRVGSEAFWPTTLDKESEKAARILRGFCKDGFYDQIEEQEAKKVEERNATAIGIPQGKQRVVKKIPASVIQNAVGLAIFTTMRTGWLFGGSGGAGVMVGRHPETHEWSAPSGIQNQNLSFGLLAGVDIYDTVLVINTYEALGAFTKFRTTLGTEIAVAAGPVGIGGALDTELTKRQSPIWSYVKSRGLYAGVALEGNMVIERTDENAKFYGEPVSVTDILNGKLRHPPRDQYQVLMDTLRAAQGELVDDSLLPDALAPSDMEIIQPGGPTFGIPAEDDPDPYGVKALEAEGLNIREAGTHSRPSAEAFEFKPAPTSPIYAHFSRRSVDGSIRSRTWRDSSHSLASVTRGTQTNEEDAGSPSNSPLGESAHGLEEAPQRHSHLAEEAEHDQDDSFSDVDSDVEVSTAVPVVTRAKVVEVPKRIPPALPPRNPGRVASPTSDSKIPLDGFDKIDLNGDAEQRHDGGHSLTPSTTREGIDSAFHSIPVTPSDEDKGRPNDVPGSFY